MRLMLAALLMLATPALSHEWYAPLKVPGTKNSCCNDEDCGPVPHRYGAGGSDEILINGQWQPVDRRVLLDNASPDGRWHACMPKGHEEPRCVIQAGGAV